MKQSFTVPHKILMIIPEKPMFNHVPALAIESLKGHFKRDWFVQHAYLCPPLVLGNEHGFIVKSLYNFRVKWDGGVWLDATQVEILDDNYIQEGYQCITSHFGMGVVTIQNRFTFRTEPGVNLMTINPPNYYIDGIQHMTGVIETDNLRRDFTFNLKITRPNEWVNISKGTPIGCVLPYPRHFIDKFEVKNATEIIGQDEIAVEQQAMCDFGYERSHVDMNKPNRVGRRYYNGEDVYGNKFCDHQRRLDRPSSENSDIHES